MDEMEMIPILHIELDRDVRCHLCETIIPQGEGLWVMIANGKLLKSFGSTITICHAHIPGGTRQLTFTNANGIIRVQAHLIDISQEVIRVFQSYDDAIYDLSPEGFEQFIIERLVAMGLHVYPVGRTNQPDGGIDIIFVQPGPFSILGAVQVKHRRQAFSKIGPGTLREFAGVLSDGTFKVGVVVTNTLFTPEAKWFAENKAKILELRDGEDLRQWVQSEFSREKLLPHLPTTISLGKDLRIQIPAFR